MFNKQKFLISTLVLFSSSFIFAQNNCNCDTALQNLVLKIESEYPGFQEKTNRVADLYKNQKSTLLLKVDSVKTQNCISILNEYISFFKDEHIYLQEKKKSDIEVSNQNEQKPQKTEIEARLLTQTIFYIKISSFKYENIVPLKNLVEQHKKQIEKAKAIIIDVRDNFGGTDDVYQPLLPYILTNPLRIMNVEFLSTQTLINGLRDYAVQNINKGAIDSLKQVKEIEDGLKEYKDNLGKCVLYNNKKVIIDTIKLKSKSPTQVIILANSNVASAGENFLFSARQSKKVKIMGTPTMGVLDYGSIREFKFGCDNYELTLPTYRSVRLPNYPIDNIGIQPDLYLDDTIGDWLEFAINLNSINNLG
ncbi:hypothetical protein J2X31_003557 [Flavobacterium arsenatis]|uniref:Tail specific protease domain-containing protein n=1 Tax=Flavobacterium arsenatis TaxID=1484332 RepID=A0ABU1TUG3_9FLAO|nr:S41 family peptidase [Flavobacterium arsenatis]MDR6969524.1 hypothetical protein [Flavobacterium arsenatis]